MKSTLEQADAYMASCVQCGRCCRETIIEDIGVIDLMREPKLREHCQEFKGQPGQFLLHIPCALQDSDGKCTIYATRPDICVSASPGQNHCCPVEMLPDETEHKIFTD